MIGKFHKLNPALRKPSARKPFLLVILLVWALLLLAGFIFSPTDNEGRQRLPTWVRIGSSCVLVIAGWCWFATTRIGPVRRYAFLIALGMLMGLVGDLLLADVIPISEAFVVGMGAFAAGHGFYIVAAAGFGRALGLRRPLLQWTGLAIFLAIGAGLWYLAVMSGQEMDALRWATLPYALLLAATAGVGTGLALQDRALVMLPLGAFLFLASDLVIAAEKFSGLFFPLIGDFIWFAYGLGQMLIVYSISSAMRIAAGRTEPEIPTSH